MTVYRTHRDALIGTRMAGDRFAARHRIIKATREGRHVGWMAQVKSDSQQGGRMMTRDHEHEYPGRQAIGGPVCGPDPEVDGEDEYPDAEAETEALARARICWRLMDENERAAVRFGMLPHWVALADLGGRDASGRFPDLTKSRDAGRLLALALFQQAKATGGMIA